MELKITEFGCFAGGLILGLLIGGALGVVIWATPKLPSQVEAVKHGAAYWRVSDDGSTEFKWKEPEEKR